MDRTAVLESVPIIFEALFAAKHEQYQNLIFEVVDLPALDIAIMEVKYLVRYFIKLLHYHR